MKLKRTAAFILAIITVCMMSSTALAAGSKNETVYAMLNPDGSVDKIYVVNQLIGEYTDYGEYTDIKNLSTLSEPAIEGDRISFPDTNVEGGLYYQGTAQGELPFTFEIKYYLDGTHVEAQSLAGANGRLKILIKGRPNTLCDERVREGYMAQVTLALDLDNAENITAEEATTVVAGNTMNISYSILPGRNATYTLEADVHDFEMSGMTITLLKGTLSGMEDTISETENGFDDMLSGADDMVEGTADLQDGMTSLADGVSALSSGMSRLSSSGDDILGGMDEYGAGLQGFTDGVGGLASGSNDVMAGLDALAANAPQVADGITSVNSGLSSLCSSSTDLKSLAQSLMSNPDPSVQALAQGTLQTLESLNALSGGLDAASQGVNGFAAGVQQAAGGYKTFDAGLDALSGGCPQLTGGYSGIRDGFSAYLEGVKRSASGIRRLNNSIKGLPENIQELLDGQIEFRDGISSAREEISVQTQGFVADDTPAVSFASPDKNHPLSVQYILKTPDISILSVAEEEQEDTNSEDFLSRLTNLFK